MKLWPGSKRMSEARRWSVGRWVVSRWGAAALALGALMVASVAGATEVDIDGEWTWTFQAGQLECRKLPMKVSLPGFAEKVAIRTDAEAVDADTVDGEVMLVDGGSAGERLRLLREADASRDGRLVPAFAGYKDVSDLLDQGDGVRGKYALAVLSPTRIEGQLEVKEAHVSGDVCTISWPFVVTR